MTAAATGQGYPRHNAATLLGALQAWLKSIVGNASIVPDVGPPGPDSYTLRMPASGGNAFFHPRDWQPSAAALIGIGALISRKTPDNRTTVEWVDDSAESIEFRIVAGPDARVFFDDRSFGQFALVGIWTTGKIVVAAVERDRGRVSMILKSTLADGPMELAIVTEAEALAAIGGRCPAPILLHPGQLAPPTGSASNGRQSPASIFRNGGFATICESWLDGAPLLNLRADPGSVIASLERALSPLIDPDNLVSIADQAAMIADEADEAGLEPGERENLFRILKSLVDKERVPSSRTHGDLKPQNILIDEKGRIGLVDWEFSRAEGIAATDMIRFVLDHRYARATSFGDFIDQRARHMLQQVQACTLPGAGLPLGQLVGLQFCIHFIDRVRRYPRKSSGRMANLCRLIASEWPLAD